MLAARGVRQLFQVVPPCGGHHRSREQKHHPLGFKSCPRVGGIPVAKMSSALNSSVSSRAPVWGASLNGAFVVPVQRVSSRAPVWGASPASRRGERRRPGFKSCPRVGGIPVPHPLRENHHRFKSCPRVGGIAADVFLSGLLIEFQVVPPCGGHPPRSRRCCSPFRGFKSCPRVGGIGVRLRVEVYDDDVSSRAPVWGASKEVRQMEKLKQVSSRAPVWGASGERDIPRSAAEFQVVPPCGGHRGYIDIRRCEDWFQVVPPCGGHPDFDAEDVEKVLVSSRAPVWGASRHEDFNQGDYDVSSRAPVWGASSSFAPS